MVIGIDGSRSFVKNRTGTENYSYQLLRYLAKIDNENTYVIFLRPGNEIEGKWPENFQFKILNFKFLWTQIGLAIETFKRPIDLLFVPAHTYPLIHKSNLKIVMTVHDLGVEYLPGMHQLKQQLYLKFITDIQLKSATKLIAVSYSTKEDLVKKTGIDEKKIEVIYEGVNFEWYQDSDIDIDVMRRFDLQNEKYFLFIGSVQPRKNLIRLIKAFKGFINVSKVMNQWSSDYKLVIAGGKGWKNKEIFELPITLGIEDQVIFTGRISDSELATLYKNAIALTYPSLFEGFGLPILEAFHFKCPVITSNLSSMPEVVGDAGLLVDPYKIDTIVDSMIMISRDEELRKELRDKGLKQLEKFSWEKCASKTLKLIKDL